jgi:hypothetical protein
MFFDSVDGEDERYYTADEFADYFRRFIRNGIFNGSGDNLQVGAQGQDMRTFIKPGYAWIEGYLYKIDIEPLELYHPMAHASLDRIDRVVIRLDKTLKNRFVKAFVLTGTPAETPQVPELTRNENIYELSLAQVRVLAGKSFIEAYQITDERLNPEVCGVVTHLFEQVDTTEIFNEWQLYLNARRAHGDTEFTAWLEYLADKKQDASVEHAAFLAMLQSKFTAFQNIWADWVKDKLTTPDGEFYNQWKSWFDRTKQDWELWFDHEAQRVWQAWVKDKLTAPDGEFYTQWQNWFEEIQDVTNLVPRSQFKEHRDSIIRDGVHGIRFRGDKLEVEISPGKWHKLRTPINTWGGM